jgi:hypothetical protein
MRNDTKAVDSNVKLLGPPLPFFIQNRKQEQEFFASSSVLVLRQQIGRFTIGILAYNTRVGIWCNNYTLTYIRVVRRDGSKITHLCRVYVESQFYNLLYVPKIQKIRKWSAGSTCSSLHSASSAPGSPLMTDDR